MWHFGQDSLTEYSGEKFEMSWKEDLDIFRIYSKEFENRKKSSWIRQDVQEYPNKPLEESFMDKLKANDNGDKTCL
jgi:hypothetical protein